MSFSDKYYEVSDSKKVLSWKKSSRTLLSLQKRLYKSILVGDTKKSLSLQNLILISNCSRLLAIREVTQISLNRRVSGIDGKTSLTFIERFHLNEFLRLNFNKWMPQSLRKILSVDKGGKVNFYKVSTISDRAWQVLIRFSLEPAHEAVFNPRNYGFRLGRSIYDVQNFFMLNLDRSSFGNQKRILSINLENSITYFDTNFLVKKLIAPRSIKLGIFRSLKKGFSLYFSDDSRESYCLSSLLLNVLLDGIESIHSSIRYGYHIIYLLKPFDNESNIVDSIKVFLTSRNLNLSDEYIKLFSTTKGFDFLGWHFKFYKNGNLISVPSWDNYQNFLIRVKHIVNNSNYGSFIKANKLYPIVREWKLYHRFSTLSGPKFSLFFIKKRAFKSFNKETKQDFYSTKKLLDKCFSPSISNEEDNLPSDVFPLIYSSHITFYLDSFLLSSKNYNSSHGKYFCIHCGIKSTYS